MTTSARRLARLAVAFTAILAMTACGSIHPGSAASVGSDLIGHDTVDDLATSLCAVEAASARSQGQPAPVSAVRQQRETALGILLENSLSAQFGELRGVEPDRKQVALALEQNQAGIALLPEDQRDGFRTVLQEYAEGQLILVAAGRASLESDGRTDVTDQEALAEGQRLRSAFVDRIDVDIDPRYGSFQAGALRPGTEALSVPVSQEAVAGARGAPAANFVSGLPASQKCG